MLKGVPVSPGITVARAYCVDEVLARREPHQLDEAALSGEVARFDNACHAAALELDAIVERVSKQLGENEAAIFRSHRLLLRDPALVGKVKSLILNTHIDAVGALHVVLDEYTALFSRIQDEYIRERMADIRDVVGRIQAQLALQVTDNQILQQAEPVILVAHEVLPSQALTLQRLKIVGIITEIGGTTGHAAILARSLGIPSVTGVRNVLKAVATGDLLALDGREGHIHVKPDSEIEAAYRKLQREFVDLRDRLVENRDHESLTKDGELIELMANVNGPADAEMAARTGACGVGLYRTEYLFLTHPTVPDEEEQLAAYRGVIEKAPNNRVVIRTLDIGGDKLLPYFGHQREANPFMGWRSIRLSTAYPEFFQTQLRAILRAAVGQGRVSILFPMVSTLEEVRRLKRMVDKTKIKLKEQRIPFRDDLRLGVMLEVPAAVLAVRSLLKEVDFVSIGSNDLIQYVMAADRDNPKVAHLCEPFNPPILRLLEYILRICHLEGKPATLCGEMAGRPRCVLPLIGMGLRKLSMSPAFVPTVKELVRSCTVELSREVAAKVRRLRTFRQVRDYLTKITRQVCPNVSYLDTKN